MIALSLLQILLIHRVKASMGRSWCKLVAVAFVFAWLLILDRVLPVFNNYFYLLAHSSSTFIHSSFTHYYFTMVSIWIVAALGVYKVK